MSKASVAKRGVLMTASSRKRGSWKDLQDEGADVVDSDVEDEEKQRKSSQLEWAELQREVETDIRKKELDSGIRQSAPTTYDDVAEDAVDEDGPPSAPSSPEPEEEAADGKGFDDDERVVPEGVTTAGAQTKEKKRGGEKRTGAARRKRKLGDAEGEDGAPPKKKKEEDPDRWLKMCLEGEDKPKKIDATRVVHYHDFDGGAAEAISEAPSEAAATDEKPVASGSFRATLRRDLFDGSDSDEDA